MDTRKQVHKIVGGPSKDRLFDACKYVYDQSSHIEIEFDFELSPEEAGRGNVISQVSDVSVVSLQHDNSFGSSFHLTGYCRANLDPSIPPKDVGICRFVAHYDTKSRTGTISFGGIVW